MSRFKDQTPLEQAFDRAIRDLRNHEITSEEYARKLDVAVKLHKMMTEEKSSPVSKDTMVVVGANLLGILMVIKHEYLGAVTSRAFSLVMRPFTKF